MRVPKASEKQKRTLSGSVISRFARGAKNVLCNRRMFLLVPLLAPLVASEKLRSWPQELNRFIFSLNHFVGTANKNVAPGKVDHQLTEQFRELEPRWKRFQQAFRKYVHGD